VRAALRPVGAGTRPGPPHARRRVCRAGAVRPQPRHRDGRGGLLRAQRAARLAVRIGFLAGRRACGRARRVTAGQRGTGPSRGRRRRLPGAAGCTHLRLRGGGATRCAAGSAVRPVRSAGRARRRSRNRGALRPADDRRGKGAPRDHGAPAGGGRPAAPGAAGRRARTHMLVVGCRGRGGGKGMSLGSVAQAVLHHSPCPVGIVHPHAM